MRLAVVSTPRSGNSWVREVLGIAYGLDQIAVHDRDELPSPLPDRVVLQAHWDRTADLADEWAARGVRVITVARHPLDVLISMLHFSRFEPTVARWLGGDYLAGLAGASPAGDAFARFAVSPGAGHLLGVTPQWWAAPGTVRVRYEEMCADAAIALLSVQDELGAPPATPFDVALAARPIELFRASPNRHGWQGRPGLWRRLIVAELAERVRRAHPQPFSVLGYDCDADPHLTRADAAAAWDALAVPIEPPG